MGSLSSKISPRWGRSRPAMVRRMVLFPAPLLPMRLTTSPRFTVKETSCTARRSLYPTDSPLTSSMISLSKVRLDDLLVDDDLLRRALDNLPPRRDDDDTVRQLHDRFHDVLDDHEGDAALSDLADQGHHLLKLDGREP